VFIERGAGFKSLKDASANSMSPRGLSGAMIAERVRAGSRMRVNASGASIAPTLEKRIREALAGG
jgi:hypothetical protein